MVKKLLAIVEIGGYPDFTACYEQAGYEVTMVSSMRKAISALKKMSPDVIVAEFNFQSDFRDRSSNLESLMAPLQRNHPAAKLVVIYEQDHEAPLQRFRERFPVHASLPFPVSAQQMAACLAGLP
jgi:hypothetical protein